MKAEIIYFSATGTTRKIVKALSQGLGCETYFTDITLPADRNTYKPIDSNFVIVATPIYGERIPRFIYDFLKSINGNGKPLVAVSVYGNMGYGISLAQFEDFAQENHFWLIAAGAFIGEHTYANNKAPVALGRPNKADLEQAYKFGRQIREKIAAGNLQPVVIPKPSLPKFITNFPDTGTRFLIRQPVMNKTVCNGCGACAQRCPVGAIAPHSLLINEQQCLRCYACVKVCPKSARTAKFRLQLFERIFGRLGNKRKENLMFI